MLVREAIAADLPFLERRLLEAYNWSGPRFDLAWIRTNDTARRLYERAGFDIVGRNGGSDTMLLRLRDAAG